jgi:hypothetical protein
MCCETFSIEDSFKDNQISANINFDKADLKEFCEATVFADGDSFLFADIPAGTTIDLMAINNMHGFAGLTYHVEIVELYDALNNAVPTAIVSTPVSANGNVSFSVSDLLQLNGNVPLVGNPYGTSALVGEPAGSPYTSQRCKKHLAAVLVLDTLPTGAAASAVKPCKTCKQCETCGCEDCCKLSGLNLAVSIRAFTPQYL